MGQTDGSRARMSKTVAGDALPPTPDGERSGIDALANRALSLVASRAARARPPEIAEPVLDGLVDAALGLSGESYRVAVNRMISSGIDAETIIVGYVPGAAMRLGALWCEDRASFADVTLAMTRLQSLVRDLAATWDEPMHPDVSVLVVVPDGTHHTLGALIVTAMLRRHGVGAHLSAGIAPRDLARSVTEDGHDVVMISASASDSIDLVRQLVHSARVAGPRGPARVVLGGSMAGDAKGARSGADLVTCDLSEALRFCGIDDS